MSNVAIIDIGTNTFHLMVVDLSNNKKILHKEKIAVRLGKGGISENKISDDASDRAIRTLLDFKKTTVSLDVINTFATATSAVRNAANGNLFVERVKKETGIDIRVISGADEATYIYEGVKQALQVGREPALVMDIGGGSVEFILCNQSEIFWLQSFEIGAQRLLDKFHHHDPMTEEDVKAVKHFLRDALGPLKEQLNKLKPRKLIGSSGTFDTLVDIVFATSDEEKLDQVAFELTTADFYKIHQELIVKNRADRLSIPGMLEMRVDMIVVASCLIEYILEINKFDSINVSTYSLKEGILEEILQKA
ncbi:MAG: exopolyphosphatase/guanosine-5'-triphosphate,3'-diphosphate pyrophosphatase [Marivirga sp.]|jgi:exopolyphosphatase/guanosine-5'-triphosphate,3'-diphosphate pyrophosphatase